jgi:hypothetical protein
VVRWGLAAKGSYSGTCASRFSSTYVVEKGVGRWVSNVKLNRVILRESHTRLSRALIDRPGSRGRPTYAVKPNSLALLVIASCAGANCLK